MNRREAQQSSLRLVVATVVGALLVWSAEAGLLIGARALLDQHAYVSDLRLDSAMKTFRPQPHPGLATPLDAQAFSADRNPRTDPESCTPLTALATGAAEDGRSWTGAGGESLVPVTLLTVRLLDASAARAELDRKRLAKLRCNRIAITFPPFDTPPTTYTVGGGHWATSAVGSTVRWSLDGGGRHFDFYVVRYGNSLTWTYDDDDVSNAIDRQQVADDLVDELRDLAGR